MTYRAAWLALGDPTRLAILERLADRPQAVVELARELPVSRPAVSQHLRVLKDAGLVIDQPVGNRRIYRVDPDGLAAVRDQLDRFWTKALAAYKTTVDRDQLRRARGRQAARPMGARSIAQRDAPQHAEAQRSARGPATA
jgi:DNA-binding transcriptional ArsR family regulator